MLVGYSDNSKAYRLYDPVQKNVFEERNVRFVENKYMFPSIVDTVDVDRAAGRLVEVYLNDAVPQSEPAVSAPVEDASEHGDSDEDEKQDEAAIDDETETESEAGSGEQGVVSILDQGLYGVIPIWQVQWDDGDITWEPRESFISLRHGAEVINESFLEWEATHAAPQPNRSTLRPRLSRMSKHRGALHVPSQPVWLVRPDLQQ
jgi:hypothetical protein